MRFLILLLITVIACNSTDDNNIESNCFPQRKVIKSAFDAQGRIAILDKNHPDTWSIVSTEGTIGNDSVSYDSPDIIVPCSLPDSFKEEGLQIIFSGKIIDSERDFQQSSDSIYYSNVYYGQISKLEIK